MAQAKRRNGRQAQGESPPADPPAAQQQAPRASTGNKPVSAIRLGRIRASIWRNNSPTHGVWYSFTLSRSYKDQQGNWKNATSFGVDDLLTLGEVCRQARCWVEEEFHRERLEAAAQNGHGDSYEPPAAPVEGAAPATAASQDIPF
jgi:hypothetical protein